MKKKLIGLYKPKPGESVEEFSRRVVESVKKHPEFQESESSKDGEGELEILVKLPPENLPNSQEE